MQHEELALLAHEEKGYAFLQSIVTIDTQVYLETERTLMQKQHNTIFSAGKLWLHSSVIRGIICIDFLTELYSWSTTSIF